MLVMQSKVSFWGLAGSTLSCSGLAFSASASWVHPQMPSGLGGWAFGPRNTRLMNSAKFLYPSKLIAGLELSCS